jgi:hypothetical protein
VGSDVVVTLSSGALIVMLNILIAVCAVGVSASVTFTVKSIGPVTLPVGVPLIAPVLVFNVSPAGSEPLLIDQAYGVIPPLAASVAPYTVPSVPAASEEVLTLSRGALTAILRFADCVLAVGVSESVTDTVKLFVPTCGPVGLPVIAPVDAFRLNPAGRLPDVTDQW